jgi:disulfide bond formation protein DsbB
VNANDVATFLALLLVGGTVGGLVVASLPSARAQVAEAALPLGALVAVGSVGASLYFSESAGFAPCELCWFQRIAMYPMALVFSIAVVTGDRRVWRYTAPMAAIGLAISLYHIQLQLFPDQSSFCEAVNPCTGSWVEALGFMTIPQMSATAFALILGLAGIVSYQTRLSEHGNTTSDESDAP